MARQSDSGHVRKICDCVRWKECRHAWYVSYREGKEIGPDGKTRDRGLRAKLEPLVGREPVDYADAKAEARRAIVAWKDGRTGLARALRRVRLNRPHRWESLLGDVLHTRANKPSLCLSLPPSLLLLVPIFRLNPRGEPLVKRPQLRIDALVDLAFARAR